VGQALFVIAAAVALIGVAPWVVPLVTGTGYSDAPRLTVLLTVANAPIAVYYGAANALTVGLGRPGLVATATVAGAGLHLITVVILAPILGVSAPPVTRFVALSAVCALLFACLARVAPEWWRDLWAALKSSWYVPPVCAAVISWAHAFPSPASGIGAMALAGYLLTLAWRRSHRLDAS
jgi:O-antigen/teichoic acid export membrane protein